MSQAKQQLHEKREKCFSNRDTRWDRIRKRHMSNTSVSLKTDSVRRFFEMDFIGKQNTECMLKSEKEARTQLDPVLVMDMRHEMFQRIPKQLPLATVATNLRRNSQPCVSHNIAVEEHYIVNELNKFRLQLEKNHKRNKVKINVGKNTLKLDNERLVQSLEATSRHIEDFYAAPIAALQQSEELCRADEKLLLTDNKENEQQMDETKEETYVDMYIEVPRDNEVPIKPIDGTNNAAEYVNEDECCDVRCVRFETEVEIRNFQRENSSCSNTSDGIDSVISDLAEEALWELQMEEESKVAVFKQQEIESLEGKIQTAQETDEVHKNGNSAEQGKETDDVDHMLIIKRLQLPQRSRNLAESDDAPSSTSTTNVDEEESTSNHEQNLIIDQLFQLRTHTNITTLRKYFLKWIHYTNIEKIERENISTRNDHIHKINVFLDRIRREKVRLTKCQQLKDEAANTNDKVADKKYNTGTVQITKKYQNKIKVQQDIIDLQRLKLERQDRLIMELKLNKLSEEAKEARQDIKNELKTVLRSGDPKSKAKAKCLQIIGNLRDTEDDEFARLQGKGLLVPKFLLNMQERALERGIRHEQARQRRLQKDAEKEAQKMAADEAKRLEDEEAKRMRIEALKEKRRQEKMAKIIKERERQRIADNNRKAQNFCRRLLLRRVGMEAFKRLLQRKRENLRKCLEFRRNTFKRTYFGAWRDYYTLLCEQKIVRADEFYDKTIKRNALKSWLIYVQDERCKYQVAVDWYDLKSSAMLFARWFDYTKRMKTIEESKMRQATSHHEWHLRWKVLDCWQRLPQILQLEKETEERRQRWRMKIWELLPDYTPNRDDMSLK